MSGVRAVLVDVYDTALTCDFAAFEHELPQLAGIAAEVWDRETERHFRAVMDGRLTLAEAFAEVLTAAGRDPAPDLAASLVRRDQELLIKHTTVYDDTPEFLDALRDRGIAAAFVSNCAENTRPLLEQLGLTQLVDTVILSCEVGASKPDSAIFLRATETLGVPAASALLVDDQERFCAGAESLGLKAVRISRRGDPGPDGVRDLMQLCGHL